MNGCRGSRGILQEHLCPGGSGPVFLLTLQGKMRNNERHWLWIFLCEPGRLHCDRDRAGPHQQEPWEAQGAQILQDMFEFSPRSNRTTSLSHGVKLRTLLLPSPPSSLPALAECYSPGSFSRASSLSERALHSSKDGFGNPGAPSPKGTRHSLPSLRGEAKSCNTLCTTSIGITCFPGK